MSDSPAAIEEVLNGFVPLGRDHPRASETAEAVRQHVEQRAARSTSAGAAPLLSLAMAAVVKPGDVLLLSTQHDITHEQAEAIRGQVLTQLPGLADAVVMSHVHVEGVYRGGAER